VELGVDDPDGFLNRLSEHDDPEEKATAPSPFAAAAHETQPLRDRIGVEGEDGTWGASAHTLN
jgi:hypothetical protein